MHTIQRTAPLLAAALGVAFVGASARHAEAQYGYGDGNVAVDPSAYVGDGVAQPAVDDVQWEERRDRYFGGPVRPGAQVDSSPSPFIWMGVGGFAAGYVLSIVGGAAQGREYAAIPLVGPWLAVANVGGADWPGAEQPAMMVISGILQPVGLDFGIYGLLSPDLFLVYDAPVGMPTPFSTTRVRWTPHAPLADVGATLVVEMF